MPKQQTAIDYFLSKLIEECIITPKDKSIGLLSAIMSFKNIVDKAKQMEKEQIVKAIDSIQLVSRRYYKDGTYADDVLGWEVSACNEDEYFGLSITGEKYYKEKYGE